MATVTQCDVCGKTLPHKFAKRLVIYDINEIGNKADKKIDIDLCIECHKKVLEVIKK